MSTTEKSKKTFGGGPARIPGAPKTSHRRSRSLTELETSETTAEHLCTETRTERFNTFSREGSSESLLSSSATKIPFSRRRPTGINGLDKTVLTSPEAVGEIPSLPFHRVSPTFSAASAGSPGFKPTPSLTTSSTSPGSGTAKWEKLTPKLGQDVPQDARPSGDSRRPLVTNTPPSKPILNQERILFGPSPSVGSAATKKGMNEESKPSSPDSPATRDRAATSRPSPIIMPSSPKLGRKKSAGTLLEETPEDTTTKGKGGAHSITSKTSGSMTSSSLSSSSSGTPSEEKRVMKIIDLSASATAATTNERGLSSIKRRAGTTVPEDLKDSDTTGMAHLREADQPRKFSEPSVSPLLRDPNSIRKHKKTPSASSSSAFPGAPPPVLPFRVPPPSHPAPPPPFTLREPEVVLPEPRPAVKALHEPRANSPLSLSPSPTTSLPSDVSASAGSQASKRHAVVPGSIKKVPVNASGQGASRPAGSPTILAVNKTPHSNPSPNGPRGPPHPIASPNPSPNSSPPASPGPFSSSSSSSSNETPEKLRKRSNDISRNQWRGGVKLGGPNPTQKGSVPSSSSSSSSSSSPSPSKILPSPSSLSGSVRQGGSRIAKDKKLLVCVELPPEMKKTANCRQLIVHASPFHTTEEVIQMIDYQIQLIKATLSSTPIAQPTAVPLAEEQSTTGNWGLKLKKKGEWLDHDQLLTHAELRSGECLVLQERMQAPQLIRVLIENNPGISCVMKLHPNTFTMTVLLRFLRRQSVILFTTSSGSSALTFLPPPGSSVSHSSSSSSHSTSSSGGSGISPLASSLSSGAGDIQTESCRLFEWDPNSSSLSLLASYTPLEEHAPLIKSISFTCSDLMLADCTNHPSMPLIDAQRAISLKILLEDTYSIFQIRIDSSSKVIDLLARLLKVFPHYVDDCNQSWMQVGLMFIPPSSSEGTSRLQKQPSEKKAFQEPTKSFFLDPERVLSSYQLKTGDVLEFRRRFVSCLVTLPNCSRPIRFKGSMTDQVKDCCEFALVQSTLLHDSIQKAVNLDVSGSSNGTGSMPVTILQAINRVLNKHSDSAYGLYSSSGPAACIDQERLLWSIPIPKTGLFLGELPQPLHVSLDRTQQTVDVLFDQTLAANLPQIFTQLKILLSRSSMLLLSSIRVDKAFEAFSSGSSNGSSSSSSSSSTTSSKNRKAEIDAIRQLLQDNQIAFFTNQQQPIQLDKTLRSQQLKPSQTITMKSPTATSISSLIIDHNTGKSPGGSGPSSQVLQMMRAQASLNMWDEPTNDSTIVFEKSRYSLSDCPAISAATFNKLVERLTDKVADLRYCKAFIMTYRRFATPDLLLSKLLERFRCPFDHPNKQMIQLRVCSVLKMWIETAPDDFDHESAQRLIDFVDDELVYVLDPSIGRQLRKSVLHRTCRMRVSVSERRKTAIFLQPAVVPSFSIHQVLTVADTVLSVDPDECALVMSSVDFQLFSMIQPSEFLNQNWAKESCHSLCSHLLAMITRFNQIGLWVSSSIVVGYRVKERKSLLKRFIILAAALKKINNYFALTAVISGINHAAVSRLKFTRSMLSKNSLKTLQDLEELMDSSMSFKRYRTELSTASLPIIPHLAVALKDLTFIEDGNEDFLDGLINFSKCYMIYKTIEKVMQFQQQPYEKIPSSLNNLLQSLVCLPEDRLYDISLEREPRGCEKISDLPDHCTKS